MVLHGFAWRSSKRKCSETNRIKNKDQQQKLIQKNKKKMSGSGLGPGPGPGSGPGWCPVRVGAHMGPYGPLCFLLKMLRFGFRRLRLTK